MAAEIVSVEYLSQQQIKAAENKEPEIEYELTTQQKRMNFFWFDPRWERVKKLRSNNEIEKAERISRKIIKDWGI